MTVMNDAWIKDKCLTDKMIEPFVDHLVRDGVSYGLSSYGYDIRLGNEFKMFRGILDPKKKLQYNSYTVKEGETFHVPPNDMVLAVSKEHFRIPNDVIGICLGKSTYARCGLLVNVTPLEPEWEGYLTLELSNTTSLPMIIYPGEGIAQILFVKGIEPCSVSYKDRAGKYHNQDNEPVVPKT
jgi:dCTP deaminase